MHCLSFGETRKLKTSKLSLFSLKLKVEHPENKNYVEKSDFI
jgi:hypothetical protein